MRGFSIWFSIEKVSIEFYLFFLVLHCIDEEKDNLAVFVWNELFTMRNWFKSSEIVDKIEINSTCMIYSKANEIPKLRLKFQFSTVKTKKFTNLQLLVNMLLWKKSNGKRLYFDRTVTRKSFKAPNFEATVITSKVWS